MTPQTTDDRARTLIGAMTSSTDGLLRGDVRPIYRVGHLHTRLSRTPLSCGEGQGGAAISGGFLFQEGPLVHATPPPPPQACGDGARRPLHHRGDAGGARA